MAEHDFRTVGLIGKYSDAGVGDTLARLGELLRARDIDVLLDEGTAAVVAEHDFPIAPRRELGERADLVIVVGGDGTLLNAARSLSDCSPPLVGINQGRLGFLTDISPDRLEERVADILDGRYLEEKRFLLDASIQRESEIISDSSAFNDVVVHKWDIARMIEVDTYIDGHFVHTMRADGLIVSTPTGSTAYALSGGGPILHPTLDAIVLVPICPHTMSNRPIVVDGNSHIELIISPSNQPHAQVTCDGQINLGLVSGDRVVIEKKPNAVRLLHPADHDHYEILRAKLHWGGRL